MTRHTLKEVHHPARGFVVLAISFLSISFLAISFLASLALVSFHSPCAAPLVRHDVLRLEEYLSEIRQSNETYQGTTALSQGANAASEEALLPFKPQFFSNLQYTDDQRQTVAPIFEGIRTVTDLAQVGIKQLFDFGLQAQLSYNISQTVLFGVSPLLVPESSLITSGLSLQFTQPLWQGSFGRLNAENRKATETQDLSNAYTNAYQAKVTVADAESRYWNLAIARETVRVQEESTDQTVAIRDLDRRRARSHLIDESDLLTAEAQAESKKLDLQNAIDNERVAARSFNSARGIDSDEVPETLPLPDPESMRRLRPPPRSEMRDDVKAAQQSEISMVARSDMARENLLPALNLTGTVSTNGLDPSVGTSVGDTLTVQYPYYSIGLSLSFPLDFGAVDSIRRAYAEQIRGQELVYHRKLFDQENEWNDLVRRLHEAQDRLALAVRVQEAQKLKFDRERARYRRGLTTTYQVIQYELDYLNAELGRLQLQGSIYGLLAQMKPYR